MADNMRGQLGSHHGTETRDDGSGRQSGDLAVDQAKEAWKQIPEADRVAAVQEYLRSR